MLRERKREDRAMRLKFSPLNGRKEQAREHLDGREYKLKAVKRSVMSV